VQGYSLARLVADTEGFVSLMNLIRGGGHGGDIILLNI